MDLGIKGKWALVCGASKGLGLGCAQALVREGVHVVIVARGAPLLEAAAVELRALPGAGAVQVIAVAADIGRPFPRLVPWKSRQLGSWLPSSSSISLGVHSKNRHSA